VGKESKMPKYEVIVFSNATDTYEIEALNIEEAGHSWHDGKLIDETQDEFIVDSIKEITES
tara:strand:+ start:347 stop:529 length:183 start_codon:yes stop_codon:yes gene_type:complete